jgi:electron transfer flavoprotein alpha subunit
MTHVSSTFDSKAHTKAVADAAHAAGATVVVSSFSMNGKLLAPRVAVRLKAGYVPGANQLPLQWQRDERYQECILRQG